MPKVSEYKQFSQVTNFMNRSEFNLGITEVLSCHESYNWTILLAHLKLILQPRRRYLKEGSNHR